MAYVTMSDGAKIFYEEYGNPSGEPLILIHGWACNHHFFKKQIPVLGDYRVIGIDLRGHGQSERSELTEYHMNLQRLGQDVKEIMDGLGIEKAALMAWSMGVSVVYDYIRQFGCEHISRMILIDMSPKTINGPDWTYGQRRDETEESAHGWLNVCVNDWQQAAQIFGPLMYENAQPKNQEDFAWVLSQTTDNVPHVMVNLVISMGFEDYRETCTKITVPTLLTHGDGSILYGKEHGAEVHKLIPGSEFKILPGGHIMFMEYPEEFNAAITDFLARTK